jgi:hypothetical protein
MPTERCTPSLENSDAVEWTWRSHRERAGGTFGELPGLGLMGPRLRSGRAGGVTGECQSGDHGVKTDGSPVRTENPAGCRGFVRGVVLHGTFTGAARRWPSMLP